MSEQLRNKIKNDRPWWYKSIKSVNYFCYKYWWLIWLLFILFLLLYFLYLCPCSNEKTCKEKEFDYSKILNCCSCDTIVPPEPPKPEPPKPDPPKPDPPKPHPKGVPCDSDTKSGGPGVTETIHNIGNKSGRVKINFDMDNQPDRLEVYYEGRRINSTFEIPGNRNGYVGGEYSNGVGVLSFDYKHNKDMFVKVVVTGPTGTTWRYTLGCPE
ncbi:MAG: hypothetical protein ACKO7P_11690 [Bacteroidota bacterium]